MLKVTGGEPVTADDLPKLTWVEAIVNEALRLYPPAAIVPRYVERELAFRGHRILFSLQSVTRTMPWAPRSASTMECETTK